MEREKARLEAIRFKAKVYGWVEIKLDWSQYMVSFTRKGTRVNVWFSKPYMTVATALKHPIQGKTQLFRKSVDMRLLERIFEYPRVHTSRGYQRK